MHTTKKRATRLALTGLAVLMAATLAACGSDTANPPPSPAQPAPAAPAATTPSKPTTAQPASRPATSRPTPAKPASRPAASPTTATRGSDFGFIRSWYAKGGTFYLRFDRAVLLTGAAADDASAAHGGESPVPNDYYIQNDNPRLREVAIIDRATVVGSQQLTGSPGPNPSSLGALLAFVHNGGSQVAATPFHLRYNDNGLVVRVQEQYVP
jgi:pyruvate/2-oxoglutarate dehydrogenase complex dihydrolipoamide acyltransferase (E2) component